MSRTHLKAAPRPDIRTDAELSARVSSLLAKIAEVGTELAVDVIGVRSSAVVRAEPMFDPAHERPRA